jgi:hypothetical protein
VGAQPLRDELIRPRRCGDLARQFTRHGGPNAGDHGPRQITRRRTN